MSAAIAENVNSLIGFDFQSHRPEQYCCQLSQTPDLHILSRSVIQSTKAI